MLFVKILKLADYFDYNLISITNVLILGIKNIKLKLKDLIWIKNYVVAPIFEEFTFRACIIPLLLQCFQPMTIVFVCPVFFGAGNSYFFFLQLTILYLWLLNTFCLAHFNQWIERTRDGDPCLDAFLTTGKCIIWFGLQCIRYYTIKWL